MQYKSFLKKKKYLESIVFSDPDVEMCAFAVVKHLLIIWKKKEDESAF